MKLTTVVSVLDDVFVSGRWIDIHLVVGILLHSMEIKYDTEIQFAWSTDTSIDIEIEYMTVV
jgi:hypothetical protein